MGGHQYVMFNFVGMHRNRIISLTFVNTDLKAICCKTSEFYWRILFLLIGESGCNHRTHRPVRSVSKRDLASQFENLFHVVRFERS